MIKEYDYLVVGSGIAGMSFALKVASPEHRVALVCKSSLHEANTALAQGGVASVTDLAVDDFEKHIHDTMVAGDWISDPKAVEKVVREAPAQIRQLLEWGVNFDRKADGTFDLHREGGHSEFRILHHADNTGFEIQESLIKAVEQNPYIDIYENHFAVEIITQHHLGKMITRRTPDITCYGAYVLNPQGTVDTFLAKVTLMATGGTGAVYQTTTNPLVATGDGIAMVYRAKGTVQDMEFIQFHPTALFHPGDRPSFLITEAMRGYGAMLRNRKGERFVNESLPYDTLCNAASYQPGGVWCQIFDGNAVDDILRFGTTGCAAYTTAFMQMGMPLDDFIAMDGGTGLMPTAWTSWPCCSALKAKRNSASWTPSLTTTTSWSRASIPTTARSPTASRRLSSRPSTAAGSGVRCLLPWTACASTRTCRCSPLTAR